MSRARREALALGAGALGPGIALSGCAGNGTGATDAGTPDIGQSTPRKHKKDTSDREGDTTMGPERTTYDAEVELSLLPTQQEPVSGNDAWCGTMQLCWDNLVTELNSGKPIEFIDESHQTEEIDRLNEMLFTTDDLRDDHYYAYTGPMTWDAKKEMEQAISDKFDQGSDILDQFDDWSDDPDAAKFLYAMLYRKFSFPTPFAKSSEPGWFGNEDDGNKATGVTYFEATNSEQKGQVSPLYYDDDEHHAVIVETEEGDTLVLVRNPVGSTLGEMYKNAMSRSGESIRPLGREDEFKCPNLDIDLQRSYDQWTGSPFILNGKDGDTNLFNISQALQTLKLHLDNEGGEVKSEAGIAVVIRGMAAWPDKQTPRLFRYDGTFAMFVVDSEAPNGGKTPYVGVLVSDITQFQHGASKA